MILIGCLISFSQAQMSQEEAKVKFLASESNDHLSAESDKFATITSDHVSSISGIHHVYFQQTYNAISIYNAVGSAHFNSSRELIHATSQFESKLDHRIQSMPPKLGHIDAIIAAATELRYVFTNDFTLVSESNEADGKQVYRNQSLSNEEIPVRLMYQPLSDGDIKLAWDLSIQQLDKSNWYSVRIDAETGELLDMINWVVHCNFDGHSCTDAGHNHSDHNKDRVTVDFNSYDATLVGAYNVYAMPLQSPADGNRTMEIDPEDPTASPFGWHDTDGVAGAEFTITRGNNAHAYDDGDNAGFSPDGGAGLSFDFAIDTTYSSGTPSEAAAITNLFYWSNIIHDLFYHYGFTEDAGNFQENNYGNGGVGSDYVFAEAQDGSGTCNANFGTPADGGNPTMQMYVCGDRDGDLDNLVIVHEYGHGISNRLTGGPAQAGCLGNSEQMGEGWSDYLGLMMTLQAGDQGTDAVGVGTWLIGEGINGPGIRQYPYSTDLSVNPHTYGDVGGVAIPHGVGSIWCAMLWEVTWALIDRYGFDADFYGGNGGNNVAMALVMEGMKLQPCNPGFVDGRDAILLADQNLYGGANQCLIWDAFAKRGLGFSADQGSSGSANDGTEAFDTPGGFKFDKTVDKLVAGPGDTLMYTITVKNDAFCNDTLMNIVVRDTLPNSTFYVSGSANNGGTHSAGVVSFPSVSVMYPGDSIEYTFKVYIDTTYTLVMDFEDNMESGGGNWTFSSTGSNNWSIVTANPNSGNNSWFAPDVAPSEDQFLELNSLITPTNSTLLSFWHFYNTEANWDGGVVQYSTNGGSSWNDLGPFIIQNGYNSRIDNNSSTPAFAGNSGGYIESIVDLSSFTGQNLNIRFWMSCDASVTDEGWYIDDVSIKSNFISNTAYATADGGLSRSSSLEQPTEVVYLLCINGVQDGDETGVDCGGAFCPPCPSCTDGIQNGDETGIDCGGPDCPACPTCNDGIQNGDEEGIDCGGSECDPCPCLENDLTFTLTFDNYPEDISWVLQDSLNNVLYSGGSYGSEPDGSTLTFDFCISDGCFDLIIFDSFGDGLCCQYGDGGFVLVNNQGNDTLASGATFTSIDSTNFCVEQNAGICDSLIELHGLIAEDVYQASHIIMSNGTIQSPDSTTFKAGSGVELNPNFEVELGASFSAEIEACMAAINRMLKLKLNSPDSDHNAVKKKRN